MQGPPNQPPPGSPPPPPGGYAPPPGYVPPGSGYPPATPPSAPPPPGYGYPGQQYPGGRYDYPLSPPNDSGAIWSLVLGILGIFCGLGIILGPIAFFLGQAASTRIRDSHGSLGGSGMALAGRILGVIDTLLWLLGLIGLIVGIAVSSQSSPSH